MVNKTTKKALKMYDNNNNNNNNGDIDALESNLSAAN